MILQFSVSNFRSFRGLQTLNLAASNADKTLPGNLISPNLPGLKGRKWLKGAALYGPNADKWPDLLRLCRSEATFHQNDASHVRVR